MDLIEGNDLQLLPTYLMYFHKVLMTVNRNNFYYCQYNYLVTVHFPIHTNSMKEKYPLYILQNHQTKFELI